MGLLSHLARPLTPKTGAKVIVFLGRGNGFLERGAGCPRSSWPSSGTSVLLGHAKLESTVRYVGIEVNDALEMAE